MSKAKHRADGERWFRQAQDDLRSAEILFAERQFAAAGFFAHQCAEKAVKAVSHAVEGDPWGHVVSKLIDELPSPERDAFLPHRSAALALDKLYVPTRYPDALGDLAPADAYTAEEIQRALVQATAILNAATEWFRASA